MRGTVAEFDDHKGFGVIAGDDGRSYFFHCTQIADGTRTIDAGTAVWFEPWPRLGRIEAAAVSPR
jgi:cold shock CspA family protein